MSGAFTPDEVHALMRVQVAMFLPASCWCGQPYANVDDFLARNVRRGYGDGMEFVDAECWDAYCKARARAIQEGSN